MYKEEVRARGEAKARTQRQWGKEKILKEGMVEIERGTDGGRRVRGWKKRRYTTIREMEGPCQGRIEDGRKRKD